MRKIVTFLFAAAGNQQFAMDSDAVLAGVMTGTLTVLSNQPDLTVAVAYNPVASEIDDRLVIIPNTSQFFHPVGLQLRRGDTLYCDSGGVAFFQLYLDYPDSSS